ncbi:DUF3224 domain-containing protein [Sphingomonas sp. RS2018]
MIGLPSILAVAAFLQAGAAMTHHATGTFEVKMTPEAQGEAPAGGLPTARMGIAKTFSGPLAGTATGTMLSAGTPGPGKVAAYVAVDQFDGTLDGRRGGFLLLHRGTMTPSGGAELSVMIVPDSGTGALRGIAGTLAIAVEGGVHRYDLAYTLPAGDGAPR